MIPVFVTRKELADMPLVADALNVRFGGFLTALAQRLGVDGRELRTMATEILAEADIEQGALYTKAKGEVEIDDAFKI